MSSADRTRGLIGGTTREPGHESSPAEGVGQLTEGERKQLEADIQYLNLQEMAGYCRAHDLPAYIHVERPDGTIRRTGDRDRKDVVLGRILAYAVDGERLEPTVYARDVVSSEPLPSTLVDSTRLRYGQFDKKNAALLAKLRELTDGRYRDGMIGRIVLRDFWTAGVAPTLREYADAWLAATAAHTEPRPEGAYLVDLHKGAAGPDWKQVRVACAQRALEVLERISAPVT